MRPRPDAAENPCLWKGKLTRTPCFNEAAARCRGKPNGRARRKSRCYGFNEAAARCRGKHGIAVAVIEAVLPLQ